MSKILISDSEKLNKKEFLSYVESLGGSSLPGDSALKNGVFTTSFTIKTKNTLHRYNLITETCRKLDTLNIPYEVIDWKILSGISENIL